MNTEIAQKLTLENCGEGFLIDHEWMAGILKESDIPNTYTAYILNFLTSEMVGMHQFTALEQAIEVLNKIPRNWKFESSHECGGEEHGCDSSSCSSASACLARH